MLAYVGVASAEPKPQPVEITDWKDKMSVFKDADGGVYVVYFEAEKHVFFGTGRNKQLFKQIIEGGSVRDGTSWSVSVHAPRLAYPFMAQVGRRADGTFFRACSDKQDKELTQITGDKRTEILDKWQFLTTSMSRRPYMLARDDRGVYYYVDVLRDVYGGSGHRVFVGKKGALKQMPVTDVTSDTAGDIFATKTGDLRLVRNVNDGREKATAQWIRGEKRNELVYLDVYMNQPLIYRELGLYKISNTICGNI